MQVFGNIFYQIRGRAMFSGGGRDNIHENNIIYGADHAHGTDRRARAAANDEYYSNGCPSSWNLLGRVNIVYEACYTNHLEPIDYQNGTWAAHYPTLAAMPNDWSQVNSSHWLEPEGCTFTCNSIWEVDGVYSLGNWGGSDPLDWYAETGNNLEADPLFVDAENMNLALRSDSPVYSQLPCFQEIPFEQIGIQEKADLVLQGSAASETIYLNWDVDQTLPTTITWTIDYQGSVGDQIPPIMGIPEPTRAYTLTGLTNYTWYTVTLTTEPSFLTGTLRIMPTDISIYLPLCLK
jgi:hypothetical protein